MKNKSHPLLGVMPNYRPTIADQIEHLTPRERQVLRGVCYGWPNKRLALELRISSKTVEKHRSEIIRKTTKNSVAALIHWALKRDSELLGNWLALERLPA